MPRFRPLSSFSLLLVPWHQEEKGAEEARMKAYEAKLVEAGKGSKTTEESLANMTALSAETKRQLEASLSERANLEKKLEKALVRVEELERERERLVSGLEHANSNAAEEANRAMVKERKELEKENERRVDALTESLESMQASTNPQPSILNPMPWTLN
jgi:DNA repair exonuclease SbcCD ATPase subunit